MFSKNALGKVICIVGVLMVILGIIGALTDDEEVGGGGGGGGGGEWKYTGTSFESVFDRFYKDEGMVYKHQLFWYPIKVMQATKNGNLVRRDHSDRVIWVETQRRYEDDEPLDKGFYIRRGSYEYTTAMGAEKTVARYVEVTDKEILATIQKQIEGEKAAAEAKAKAEAEAEAKAKAEREAAEAKREAEFARAKGEIASMIAGKTAGESKTILLPGGVELTMVWCPPGTFTMWDQQVTLTKGFWIGKTEVTQAQWKSVMGNNPSDFTGDDNLPVDQVSWNDCQELCDKLGLQLPTEAQWEYACRAGSTGPYAGSGNLDEMGWYERNSGGKTHPVGTKQPNAWGLYDMHGNMLEWCEDWYSNRYSSGAVKDPRGPSSGKHRVVRGGGCRYDAAGCTSSSRLAGRPESRGIGFRLVRTLSE
jgi:formylglycine-generating enzyme required for sulfatase activity